MIDWKDPRNWYWAVGTVGWSVISVATLVWSAVGIVILVWMYQSWKYEDFR